MVSFHGTLRFGRVRPANPTADNGLRLYYIIFNSPLKCLNLNRLGRTTRRPGEVVRSRTTTVATEIIRYKYQTPFAIRSVSPATRNRSFATAVSGAARVLIKTKLFRFAGDAIIFKNVFTRQQLLCSTNERVV